MTRMPDGVSALRRNPLQPLNPGCIVGCGQKVGKKQPKQVNYEQPWGMIAPVFDEIPAYEQAFSPNLLFFQHPHGVQVDKQYQPQTCS